MKVKLINVDACFTKDHAERVAEKHGIKNGAIREAIWLEDVQHWKDIETDYWFTAESVEVQE